MIYIVHFNCKPVYPSAVAPFMVRADNPQNAVIAAYGQAHASGITHKSVRIFDLKTEQWVSKAVPLTPGDFHAFKNRYQPVSHAPQG